MTDPDLRRVLGAQSTREVGHVPSLTVGQGRAAIAAALTGDRHLITDAITDADLIEIGAAARDLPLLCGGSGIALGLPANYGLSPRTPSWTGIQGPGVVLSGSCSWATRAQVAEFAEHAPSLRIEVETAMDKGYDPVELAEWALAQERPGLIYSSADPDVVAKAQTRFGTGEAAAAIERLFEQLALELMRRGVRRIVVAGGETSGSVVRGLGARQLKIGPRAAAGVPLVSSGGLALALKSGNFGGPRFFQETLTAMELDA